MLGYLSKPCETLRHLERIHAIESRPCPYTKGHRRQLHYVMWRYELGLPLFALGDCQERVEVSSVSRLRPRKDRDTGLPRGAEKPDFLPGFQSLGGGKHRRGKDRVR